MYVEEEVHDNMWNEIYLQGLDIVTRFLDKAIILLSLIFGTILSQIGYPKQVFLFILILVIADLVTKHLSIVVINYGSISFKNYKQGWIDRKLTSRQLKNGIAVKVILYSLILYVANMIGVIPEVIFGSVISNTLYTMLILVEVSSIFENFISMGFTNLIPFLNIINKKKEEVSDTKTEI